MSASKLKRAMTGMPVSDKSKGAFIQTLSPEALEYFNTVANSSFSEQATAFLNAYWKEIGSQAEFIFNVAWDTMKYADMHSKGVSLIHLYEEGSSVELNIGLYFYEKLCKRVLDSDDKVWRKSPEFEPSMPKMMTAIKRKQELRDKVDVNFDGRVSFLEYLLYQYRDFANPAEFTQRAMEAEGFEEHPEIVNARTALERVNAAILAFEAEKARLTEGAKLPGVKGLTFNHQLTMLMKSPVAENLSVALIKAEAAVRMATRRLAKMSKETALSERPVAGSMWWMNRDLAEKKARYGPQHR